MGVWRAGANVAWPGLPWQWAGLPWQWAGVSGHCAGAGDPARMF